MKFNYYKKESKIYDLLQFPRILYTMNNEDGYTDQANLNPLEEMDDQRLFDMVKDINLKLQPFKEEINVFYANEYFSSYDLFVLLTAEYSLLGFESMDDYIEMILAQPEDSIKENLLFSLLITESDRSVQKNIDSTKKQVKDLVAKQSKMMQFIKELPTESNYKWNLLMILENPIKMIKQFFTLLKQLEPIFEEVYKESQDDILEAEETLSEVYNANSKEKFLELSQNMLDEKNFNEENHLFISFIFVYSFLNRETSNGRIFVWGTKMERGFEIVSKMHGDRIVKTTKVFKVLGDKTRYEVLQLIAGGMTSTKDIAKQLGVTSATISYHINSFVTNNIIKHSSKGKRKYVVDFELLNELWENFIADMKEKV